MLKKLLIICLLFSGTAGFAQFSFGVNAGYNNSSIKSSAEEVSVSTNESGYFLGVVSQYFISGKLQLEGSVNYVLVEDSNFLQIPVLLKYYVGNTLLNLQAGPQATINLDEIYGPINRTGLDLAFGAGYDITQHFFVFGRYAFELTNRTSEGIEYYVIDESPGPQTLDVTTRLNTLNIGVGYKF